jgi:hypothetical protein
MASKPNNFDQGRQQPAPLQNTGAGYDFALHTRANAILNGLMSLRASNYNASVPSTEYAAHFRAIAFELARFTINLEQYTTNISYEDVQSELLHQIIGCRVFVQGQTPDLKINDESFRNFLLTVIDVYFKGSTPESLRSGIELFTSLPITIKENFLDTRKQGSLYNISDQFGFRVEVTIDGNFPPELFELEQNVRILLDLIRPAHTLYTFGFVLRDGAADGGGSSGNTDSFIPFQDAVRYDIDWYLYDDLRGDCYGIGPITSDQGIITNLLFLQDLTMTQEVYDRIALCTQITILDGPNAGVYTVTSKPSLGVVKVAPSFREITLIPFSFLVEVDRAGKQGTDTKIEDRSSDYAIG